MAEQDNLESEIQVNGSKNLKRTTIFLPEILDENLEAYSLTSGDAKSVIIRRALLEHLKSQGMQPHKKPKVSVSY
jgi:hypothetical protein